LDYEPVGFFFLVIVEFLLALSGLVESKVCKNFLLQDKDTLLQVFAG